MADPAHPPAPAGGGPKINPGTLFGYLFLGGLGIFLLLMFLGMGVDAFGAAKRRYPEVVMGLIVLGLIGAFIGASKSK